MSTETGPNALSAPSTTARLARERPAGRADVVIRAGDYVRGLASCRGSGASRNQPSRVRDVSGELLAAIALAFAFAFTNGFHDAANAVAALVATRVARPLAAIVMASLF